MRDRPVEKSLPAEIIENLRIRFLVWDLRCTESLQVSGLCAVSTAPWAWWAPVAECFLEASWLKAMGTSYLSHGLHIWAQRHRE